MTLDAKTRELAYIQAVKNSRRCNAQGQPLVKVLLHAITEATSGLTEGQVAHMALDADAGLVLRSALLMCFEIHDRAGQMAKEIARALPGEEGVVQQLYAQAYLLTGQPTVLAMLVKATFAKVAKEYVDGNPDVAKVLEAITRIGETETDTEEQQG